MITDMLELIKLAREILEKKRVIDKEYFNNFVEPVWVVFQRIHADYKSSFLNYSELATDSNGDTDLLIKKINQDIIYSEDMRTELYSLASMLQDSNIGLVNEQIEEFIEKIMDYFISASKIDMNKQENDLHVLFYEDRRLNPVGDVSGLYKKAERKKEFIGKLLFGDVNRVDTNMARITNSTRYGAIIYISRKKHELGSEGLDSFFNIVMAALQRKYLEVSNAYYEIRTRFLSGI